MPRGLNKATIIGFVQQQPEKRYAANGQAVTFFCVSSSRRWTTNAGQARESTEWFNVVAWGDLAEAVSERLRPDQRVYIEGPLQTRSWDEPDGQRHCRTEIVANLLIPMGQRQAIRQEDLDGDCEVTPLCLNRVMVVGNLGRDPEMRYTPGGQAVTVFSLAATRSWISEAGERRNLTEWLNVVAWGSLAEICNQYLAKGRRVYIEGELRTRGWAQPDGHKHFRTELVANEMIILGPRPQAQGVEAAPNLDRQNHPFH